MSIAGKQIWDVYDPCTDLASLAALHLVPYNFLLT